MAKKKYIGNYEVIKPLSSGTMANIYLAKHILTKEVMALKKLDLPNELYKKRFIQEARILKSLNHPNILRIFEVGKHQAECLFYTMELKSKSLSECLDNPPFEKNRPKLKLTLDQKLLIIYDITKALIEIHKNKIVHRDINPKNILLNLKYEACLCDFGLSKLENEEIDEDDKANPKGYGPPEQDIALSKAQKPADVYSFGVTAYQLLSGVLPKGRNFPKLYESIGNIPFEISNIIDKCLDTNPEERPTAIELNNIFGKYFQYQEPLANRDFEETSIPIQFKEILGSGLIDYNPLSVDEVSFCIKNCKDSYFYSGLACRALAIDDLQKLLLKIKDVKFVIANPNNENLISEMATIFNKKNDEVKADILTSITILKKLQTINKSILYRCSDSIPPWRILVIDNKFGLLRNYKGNRLPYQSPLLRIKSGAFLDGMIRYNNILWAYSNA